MFHCITLNKQNNKSQQFPGRWTVPERKDRNKTKIDRIEKGYANKYRFSIGENLGNTAQFTSGISLNSNSREKHGSSCSLIRESIRLQAVRQGLSARGRSANANIILHLARCFRAPRYRVLRKRSCFLTTPNTCSTFARTEDFACSAFFASYWSLPLSFLI